MKKRVYIKTPKRQRVLDEALGAARAARDAIDPALLERVRSAIGDAAEEQRGGAHKAIHAERVPVDRKKTLNIVLKYLELCPDNTAVHGELRAFLTRH